MCRTHGATAVAIAVTWVDDDSQRPAFDLPRIVEVFKRHGVAYLAIGGVSGLLHGVVHYVTQDVDMMVRSTAENLELIIRALTELGATIPPDLQADDLSVNTQWVTPSGRIDILLTALGPNETVITFSELDVDPFQDLPIGGDEY